MSSATLPVALPNQEARFRAVASSLPADLSHAPVFGIIGVVLGAGIVTIQGRLISLGLADMKGSLGISFDDGAWISSAFNVALMFIVFFTVYLGAILGPRRVLLAAAAIFSVVTAFLPLVHNYSLLITLLVIAGLASGTFYPLTLTFALRNIPFKFFSYTIALYATSIETSVNFAPSLYGFYRNHFSWEWMFWTSAIITPVMMYCVHRGIPKTPIPHKSGKKPSFLGLLYASFGFSLLFAALDQGQRLDWWRSGLFNALFFGGLFLLLFSIIRRLRMPNPLVDLPYLRKWNTQALAIILFFFRFSLLGTIIIIPQALGVHGLDAAQIGPAVIWTAIPELFLAFVGAWLLAQGVDSRLLMAFGFACIGIACCLNAQYTSAWAAESFYRTELLMAVGQTFAFMGLVSTIILQAMFSGGFEKPAWILTFSALMHLTRLFGGQVGVVLMTRFLAEREKLHSNLLGLQVQSGDWITSANLQGMTAALASKSSGIAAATGRAAGLLGGRLRLQAYSLTFVDAFHLVAWACVATLVLISILRRAPYNYGELLRVAKNSGSNQEGKS